MAGKKVQELIRLIEAEGNKFEFNANGAGLITGKNGERVRLEKNGDLLFASNGEALAERVGVLRDEVNRSNTLAPETVPATEISMSETMRELIRRIRAEGYNFRFNEVGDGLIAGASGGAVTLRKNGDILYRRESENIAFRLEALRDEVNEYMTAYRAAVPGALGTSDTRALLVYNGHELAARRLPNETIDFVTWRHDRDGYREIGHYYDDYAAAKQDFAARAGLIDRDKLFTEKELTVIRSNLSDYLAMDSGDLSYEREQATKGVLAKIDNIIEPQIEDQQEIEETEEADYELEID